MDAELSKVQGKYWFSPRENLIGVRGECWPTVFSGVTIPIMNGGRGHGRSIKE